MVVFWGLKTGAMRGKDYLLCTIPTVVWSLLAIWLYVHYSNDCVFTTPTVVHVCCYSSDFIFTIPMGFSFIIQPTCASCV